MGKLGKISIVLNKKEILHLWPVDNSKEPDSDDIKTLRASIINEVDKMCGMKEDSSTSDNEDNDTIKKLIKSNIPFQ